MRVLPRGLGLLVALTVWPPAQAGERPDLYQAAAIVTGQGEESRQTGFRECLDEVLVRVSGDQRLLGRPELEALRDKAGSFVEAFRYRDRMEGIPVHDEQGTYDRPHDLTCLYEPSVVDGLLKRLGSRPWLEERPALATFLAVERGSQRFLLTSDGDDSPYIRDAFEAAAEGMAMEARFPPASLLQANGIGPDSLHALPPDALDEAVRAAGGDAPLIGRIVWSDADLGWVADWRFAGGGEPHQWQVRGVSFDDAFRVGVRGAAQILSGNGSPG